MIYNELTWRHFATTAHAGVLVGPGARRGAAGSRAQGTWVQFDLRWDEQWGGLREVRFQAFGCPHVIAVSDWIAQQAVGVTALAVLPESVSRCRPRNWAGC
jgi:NifU-like protein involved in Fe-S cluster formation